MAWELIKKWCSIGTKTALPQSQDGVIPNRASYDEGFPAICSDDPNLGGLPPRREDMNEILYLTSANLTELQSGNYPTFNADVSTFLGGYPLDAVLWCASQKYFVRSTKASNTDNFVTTPSFLGTSWVRLVDTIARTPFCINSGNVDTNGNGDLLSATGNILSFKVGGSYPSIIGTTADGVTFTFATLGTLDFGSDADGTYNVFIDNLGNLTKYKNTIYRQKKYPTAPVTNDIFLNTSIEVLQSYKYGGSTYTLTAETPVGQVIKTSGVISSVTTFAYNYNGYNINRYSFGLLGADLTAGVTKAYSGFTAESDGWIYCEGYSDSGYVRAYVNGVYTTIADSTGAKVYVSSWIYVTKGDICSMGNTPGSAITSFIFYPIKGAI